LIVAVRFAVDQRLERLLAAHHLVCTYRDTSAFMALVGPVIDLRYALALQRFCDELNLHHTWLGSDEAGASEAAGTDAVRVTWSPEFGDVPTEMLADALMTAAMRRDEEIAP
jgi:hypothetical protein